MGAIDSFLNATVAPLLGPGEQTHGLAYLKQPTRRNLLDVPEAHDHWLVAATNMRLLLFRTAPGGGMFDINPKAEARDVQSYWYDEIETMHGKQAGYHQLTPGGSPQSFGIVPRPQLGPFDGRTFAFDAYNVAEGIDGQERFAKEFLPWLAQQVTAGAFPVTPERQAQFDARRAAAAQRMEEMRVANEARSAQQSAWFKRNAPAFLLFALFGLALFGAFVGANDLKSADSTVEMHQQNVGRAKRDLAAVEPRLEACEAGKDCACQTEKPKGSKSDYEVVTSKTTKTKYYCSPKSYYVDMVKKYEEDLAEAEHKRIPGIVEIVASLVGALLALVLFFVALAWRKKQLRPAAP